MVGVFNLRSSMFHLDSDVALMLMLKLCVDNYSNLYSLVLGSYWSFLTILFGFVVKMITHYSSPKIQKLLIFVIWLIDSMFLSKLEMYQNSLKFCYESGLFD